MKDANEPEKRNPHPENDIPIRKNDVLVVQNLVDQEVNHPENDIPFRKNDILIRKNDVLVVLKNVTPWLTRRSTLRKNDVLVVLKMLLLG